MLPDDLEMASFLAGMMPVPTVGSFAGSHADLVRQLRRHEPHATATSFAGLLTRRETRANCLRLECLVALALRHGAGRRRPDRDFLGRAFRSLGSGWAGRSEDPAEDVAIARVLGMRGSYAIFTGLAEGAASHLERFLDVIDHMPDGAPWEDLRESTYALLALSDEVVRRSGGIVHELGATSPVEAISSDALKSLTDARGAVTFTLTDLAALGVQASRLAAFVFNMDGCREMDSDPVHMTRLERRPILACGETFVLVLPTAIARAIQRMVIEFCLVNGMKETLERKLARSYGRFLYGMDILGGVSGAPFVFRRQPGMSLASVATMIDDGRWLQLVAWMDHLDGYETDDFSGTNQDPIGTGQAIMAEVQKCAADMSKREGFRGGITLVVSCSWGRSLAVAFEELPSDWRMTSASAHDLQSMSDLPGMRPAHLWRMLDMRDAVERSGVTLVNPNGLINLVAWARRNDEHVIPHAHLPLEFDATGPNVLMIEQNALLALRHESAVSMDRRLLPGPGGKPIPVERTTTRPVDGHYLPHYMSRELFRGGLLNGAVMTDTRVWWVHVCTSEDSERGEILRHWEMLHHWLGVAAPVLDERLTTLPSGPILWDAQFDGLVSSAPYEEGSTEGDPAVVAATLTCEAQGSTVRVRAEADFQRAYRHVSNVAERTLVRALVTGTALLAGIVLTDDDLDGIVDRIIPGRDARHIHYLLARGFRDHVSTTLPRGYIKISRHDDAFFRLGFAGRVRGAGGGTITGKAECITFLNQAVARTERELCTALKEYARTPFLLGVIGNHEQMIRERSQWQRTSLALLAQRGSSDAAYRMIAESEGRRNAVAQSSRILLEAGLCECPSKGRTTFGEIDLSRLMVMANSIVATGGWSNAIRWGVMEPLLRISPLGDILTASTFEADIVEPFGLASNRVMTDAAAARYHEFYAAPPEKLPADSLLDTQFTSAWLDEIGLSMDEVLEIVAVLGSHGVALGKAAFRISREGLATLLREAGIVGGIDPFLRSFVLPTRATWFDVPDGFLPREREVWRFRRRLSILRRPILDPGDGELIVAPGMVQEGISYVLRNFHDGIFDEASATSPAMKSWIGTANNTHGHAFNRMVAMRLEELGWQTRSDLKMTALLRKSLPRDYGDVDVLAWNPATGRVLLVECKDLHFPKTMGEIAEQLADFRGELNERGRPDHLRKHLNRYALANDHATEVQRFTGLVVAPHIECHVVFRYPVPITFMKGINPAVEFTIFKELETI